MIGCDRCRYNTMIINLVEAVAHPDKSDPTGEEPIILRFVRHDFTPD